MRDTFMEDTVKSVIAWGSNFINGKDIKDLAWEPIQYHVWDAYGDQTDYPDKALFGHSSFAMDTDGFFASLNFSYGLSFPQDKDLARHVSIMSRLLARLTPGNQIPFLDGSRPPSDQVEDSSWLIITDETSLLPVVLSLIHI